MVAVAVVVVVVAAPIRAAASFKFTFESDVCMVFDAVDSQYVAAFWTQGWLVEHTWIWPKRTNENEKVDVKQMWFRFLLLHWTGSSLFILNTLLNYGYVVQNIGKSMCLNIWQTTGNYKILMNF